MRVILSFSLIFILAGCNGVVTDYVKGVTPPSNPVAQTPVIQPTGPMTMKISPGVLVGTGSNMAVQAHVTTTDHLYPAGDMSARLTISRTRVSPQ